MAKPEVIAAHVGRLMERWLAVDRCDPDEDGVWRVRNNTASYHVRVLQGERPHVQVYSVVADGVRVTKPLLLAMNELNERSSHARWFVAGDRVITASELVGDTLDYEEFACTVGEVASAADSEGPRLASNFGGQTAFPAEGAPATAGGPGAETTGGYL